MDSISNKLLDLHDDVVRRDPVAFRMRLHELARRGLHDAELDVLTRAWSTGFDEGVWKQLAERLAAVSKTYDSEIRLQ
jgi:hypothetical protein